MSLLARLSFKNLTPDEMVLRVSGLSLLTALILIVLKSVAVVASGSMALLASLADSGLDLMASFITFLAIRFARRPPDSNHPFGHGKAEAFSALFQAGLVFFSAALILREGFVRLSEPQVITSGGLAIVVMIVSILLTGALVTVQGIAAKASGSVAIQADRAHYMVDLLSNGVALMGIIAAVAGFGFVDALAGLVIGLWLVWGAIGVLRQASDHLM
ncbi:MAG: cation diffusion facilitator family transporter, partial [Asticcacaulis sp.]